LKTFLTRLPNYGDVFYKLGLCYLELDKPQQGISELKKMIERYPRYVPAYFTLAYAYMREGWSDEAIALCQKGLELSPNNVKGLEILAKANITTKNFDEAERAYENLIKARPGRVADLLSLASLKINKGEIDQAYEICNEVLKINEKNVNAHSLKGFCYIRKGKIDNAIEEFRQVIQIDPLNISGHLNLAKIYSSVSRFEEAEEELLNLIELKPDYKDVQKELGNLYFVQGKYDKAIEFFTKILNENPHDLHTNLSLAGTYFAKEDYEQALKILEPFRKNPKFDDNLKLHSFLATIYFKLNDNEEAEKEYRKVLAIDPHFRPAYDLGLVYMDQGKAEESIEVYKQALKINPDLTEMMLHLAIAQQKNGLYNEALDSIMNIIKLEQQNYSLYFIQINILAAKGDYEKAESILAEIPEITDEVRDSYKNVIDMCRQDKESGRKLAYMLNQMKIYRSRGWINQAIELAKETNKMVPENVLPLAFLAEVYNDEKDYDNMKKMLDKILAVDPNSFIGNLRTSRYYSMNNKFNEAIKYLNKAVEVKSENATLLLDLGILYEKNKDVDNAIITYKKVLELAPERYRAMNNLAWLLSEYKKDYDQAESYSRQALDLAPKNGAVADTYGWILYQKGEYQKAKEILELAQRYLPSNSSVAYHLGKTYLALDEKESARIALQKAIDITPDFPEADEVKSLLEELSE
jgi:tetratricopeptide (TPR) repeat protein